MLRDGFHQTPCTAAWRRTGRTPSTAAARSSPARTTGAYIEVPADVAAARKVREAPASFDDHFSQARLFWLQHDARWSGSTSSRAYTFELGKCYEQAIKERQLRVLANIDPELCAQVAAGLGLPAPEPTEPLADVDAEPGAVPARQRPGRPTAGSSASSPTRTATWPVSQVRRRAILDAGMVPLVIAPRGGTLPGGDAGAAHLRHRPLGRVRRAPAGRRARPGAGRLPRRDAKAGAPGAGGMDPRVRAAGQGGFRHAKVIGGWGTGVDALTAGCLVDDVGVVTGEKPASS